MSGTGENPGNNIKIEKSNASPVQTANDQNDECKSVKHFNTFDRLNLRYRKRDHISREYYDLFLNFHKW